MSQKVKGCRWYVPAKDIGRSYAQISAESNGGDLLTDARWTDLWLAIDKAVKKAVLSGELRTNQWIDGPLSEPGEDGYLIGYIELQRFCDWAPQVIDDCPKDAKVLAKAFGLPIPADIEFISLVDVIYGILVCVAGQDEVHRWATSAFALSAALQNTGIKKPVPTWYEINWDLWAPVATEAARVEGMNNLRYVADWPARHEADWSRHVAEANALGEDPEKARWQKSDSNRAYPPVPAIHPNQLGFDFPELNRWLFMNHVEHVISPSPNSEQWNRTRTSESASSDSESSTAASPISEATATSESQTARPQKQQVFQREQIVKALRDLGYDPKAIPKPTNAGGAKRAVRERLVGERALTRKVFDKAWQAAREANEIMDAKDDS